ncbi:hypothetical protein CSIM01_03702 [Colletotrichum simmondsii]|uniref:Uncharacterized protein n=1 Tax=Colletotrichum simmondsii TaxID=703756 RepID=A0A135RRH0_9PEZI|nr:hypothetical protein CSIM01_03702 [Colletotrichum simmondsii]
MGSNTQSLSPSPQPSCRDDKPIAGGIAPMGSNEDQSLVEKQEDAEKQRPHHPDSDGAKHQTECSTTFALSGSQVARRLTLDGLLLEIQLQVLRNLSDLDDLHAAICASPTLHRCYLLARRGLLYHHLGKTFHSHRIFVAAFAAYKLGILRESTSEDQLELREEFMGTYLNLQSDPENFKAICTVDDLAGIARFYSLIVTSVLTWLLRLWGRQEARDCIISSASATERIRMIRGLYHFEIWCSYYGLGSINARLLPTTSNADILRFLNKYLQPREIEELSCIYCEIRLYYRQLLCFPSGTVNRIDPDTQQIQTIYQALSTPKTFGLNEGPLSPAYECFFEALVTRGLERFYTIWNCEDFKPQLISQLQDDVSILLRNLKVQGIMVEGASDDEDEIIERQLDREGFNRLDHVFKESIRGVEVIDTDRHIAQMERRELLFQEETEEGPPFGWVVLWAGTYSNCPGIFALTPNPLPTQQSFGYVFMDKKNVFEELERDLKQVSKWESFWPDPRDRWL